MLHEHHRLSWRTVLVLCFARKLPNVDAAPSLHALADHFGTDKSLRAGHGYVSAYSMLLEPMRHTISNMTEVGVLTGSSLLMWASNFPHAEIWGLDIALQSMARERCSNISRIHLRAASSQSETTPQELGLVNETMDLVIDDGDHSRDGNARTAASLWRLVRPGGLYVIEDVATGADRRGKYGSGGDNDRPGWASVVHHPSPVLSDIYDNNDVFFADTMVGAGFAQSKFVKQQIAHRWMKDQVDHNGHLVVVRKRAHSERRDDSPRSAHAKPSVTKAGKSDR